MRVQTELCARGHNMIWALTRHGPTIIIITINFTIIITIIII